MNWLPAMLIAVAALLSPAATAPPGAPPGPAVAGSGSPGLSRTEVSGAGLATTGGAGSAGDAGTFRALTDLSITVERDSARAVPGEDARYTITVTNPGEPARRVMVRASLPPWISGITAEPEGRVGDGYVDWVVSVAPADTATLRLRGSYPDPPPDGSAGTVRVALTACVVTGSEHHPVVCDTDVVELADVSPVVVWSLVASGAALSLAAVMLVRITTRRREEAAPARAT